MYRRVCGFVIDEDDKVSGGNYSSLWDSFTWLDGMAQAVVKLYPRRSVKQEALDSAEHVSSTPCY